MPVSLLDRYDAQTSADLIAMVRRELEMAPGVLDLPPLADEEFDRVVIDTVQPLWAQSRIKTFLPVLAVRAARVQFQATISSPALTNADPCSEQASIAALAHDLHGRIDLHLTFCPGEPWHARLSVEMLEEAPLTVHVTTAAETLHQAMQRVVCKARDVLLP